MGDYRNCAAAVTAPNLDSHEVEEIVPEQMIVRKVHSENRCRSPDTSHKQRIINRKPGPDRTNLKPIFESTQPVSCDVFTVRQLRRSLALTVQRVVTETGGGN